MKIKIEQVKSEEELTMVSNKLFTEEQLKEITNA